MKISQTIILLLYTSTAFAQSKNLELRLEILKDTVELLQPFEYCMYFSNNSSDSIETNAFPWENYKKPWLEIKSIGDLKWKKLYKSDVELGMDFTVRRIYGPLNCWSDPRKSRKIPPKAQYCKAAIYYPLWENESQIYWKSNKKFKIRIAFYAGKNIGIIRSKSVNIYVNSSARNDQFLKGMLQKGLNTEQLFEPWGYCGSPDSIKIKFAALEKEHQSSYLANWITMQALECKFSGKEYYTKPEYGQKIDLTKSLPIEQRKLVEKLLEQRFYPKSMILGTYSYNIDKWFFDMDFQDNEIKWINKMLEPKQPVCNCKLK